ncbi:unnamed protein product [Phytophthora fragariaefolia]|uniref:Unnamed protein product n=1 Tax=Phytophthora fragariaefolia TaxID=1490495 RepID=A0A9W7CYC9_9STRA|nr:unnamed protein product [Phytophthora fragariaefolia]
MACSCAGLVSLIVLFAAVVLNIVAFSLPLWTTSSTVNESLQSTVDSSDFAAGVWGFCTDVEFSAASDGANASATFDHCYLFHTSSKYDVTELDSDLMANFSDYSVCDGYSRAGDESDATQLAFASALATTAGMDATQFNKFLHKSCGALGSATLAFGGISMSAGVLSFVALALGITCCKRRSFFVLGGKVFVGIALVSTVLMFALWIPQAHPLSKADDVTLNGSFVLAIISAVLYMIALGLVARHARIKG